MNGGVPDKLLKIVADIDARQSVPLARLTVLKKWFERPGRLAAFAHWLALRAIARKVRARSAATPHFREARELLLTLDPWKPSVPARQHEAAFDLHQRVIQFQNKYRRNSRGLIRIIENWNLFLVESSLEELIYARGDPALGYRLAANYCRHDESGCLRSGNIASIEPILEIARWTAEVNAQEDQSSTTARPKRRAC